MISSRSKKIACTISAAALMLGVSSGATIGLHFMENYCGAPAYSGYPVTLTAFGVESNAWENLYEMNTGYGSCGGPLSYETNEVIDTTTSTNGLNPLPNGSLSVTWFGATANFDPFYGYAGSAPYYTGGGPLNVSKATGEQEIYATFIRDGINFGPPGGADNPNKLYYWVDITGLKSLFTNSPFVVELMASSDSMQTLTNAFVIDLVNSITNSVEYTNTPPVAPGFNSAPWYRNTGGGLSTGSAPLNTDHIYIKSNIPQHGTDSTTAGFDNAGTISGFIITDKPVISMSPQSVPLAGPGDTVVLSAYAIGVPPLSYQWQHNGQNIPGANTLTNTIASAALADSGSYTLIVSNAYGVATSKVSVVTVDTLTQSPTVTNNVIVDTNPDNTQHNGVNMGATWLASSTAGAVTRNGVMSFTAVQTNGITVPDESAFDGPIGTFTFWMRSAGTDTNDNVSGAIGASIFERPNSNPSGGEFALVQYDSGSGGGLDFVAGDLGGLVAPSKNVSDNNWHFVALTFDQTTNGGAALYIDGTLASTNSNGGLSYTWPTGQALEIGYDSGNYYRNYNGLLDDVRYYSSILSASEITSIFNSDALADTADLQFQYNFTTAPQNGIVLTWGESTAVLQSAPSLSGPWADVTGATSPYTIVPANGQQFFRYRYVHQTEVSNPYLM